MTKITTIIGILLLAGAVAVPVMAWGPHWGGGGHHMMGYWGSSPEYGRGSYGNLTSEQKTKLEALDRKFYNETKELRDQIWTKSRELDVVLNSSNPDIEKAKALHNDIRALRAELDEKMLTYDLEARKILPDRRLGYGNGGWYGHHMGTYGPMMGYGPGYCWN
jgi:zinc resistance-associated protein